jgi:hypothetical protein
MPKLTLSIDKTVATRAKRYAKEQGTSVSKLVETYLDVLSEPPHLRDVPPILRSLRGTLKKADVNEYRKHLIAKHR